MKKVLVALTIASAMILTGCSHVNVAATVGSTKITQADLQKSIDTVLAERVGTDQAGMQLQSGEDLTRGQLRFHLISALFRQIASEAKIKVTKAEIDARRASIVKQVGGEKGLPNALAGANIASVDLDAYLELLILSDKIGEAAVAAGVDKNSVNDQIQRLVAAKAAKEKIDVNPRYGKWDYAMADLVAVDSANSAVSPAATP
ncbi:MAG: SurA N-terminal domain-containing protein [Actinobacteria bacterium]|nr:SurA N-terminal domain-containing protein [Actinomycetota bacterium]